MRILTVLLLSLGLDGALYAATVDCVSCHRVVTPQIVTDWELSRHSAHAVDCSKCHGSEHDNSTDFQETQVPTPQVCAECHKAQFDQYDRGKHASAWSVLESMPATHWLPMAEVEGVDRCGSCHKIGLKSAEEIRLLKKQDPGAGVASCDACHTRHLFSVAEARQPQSCQTCHMGPDHPQWEAYSSSKHGVRFLLKQAGVLPESTAAPTCQTCHMAGGNHSVRTAWGYFAVRLPLPADPQWAEDRRAILQALGILNAEGNPATSRRLTMGWWQSFTTTNDQWQERRDEMVAICSECHAANFAIRELKRGDDLIRSADHLMAEAIRVVAELYRSGRIRSDKNAKEPFPDLLSIDDCDTLIEQKLFMMFHQQRMSTFQGAFHGSANYSLTEGWNEMRRNLAEIRQLAEELR